MLGSFLLFLRKNSQKSVLRNVVAPTMAASSRSNSKNTTKAVKKEAASAQANMARIADTFSDSVKGEFGTEVRRTFIKQTERVNELL